ncbi:hypothetical protein GCM10027445_05980 [Amycolatopsis endophytica]
MVGRLRLRSTSGVGRISPNPSERRGSGVAPTVHDGGALVVGGAVVVVAGADGEGAGGGGSGGAPHATSPSARSIAKIPRT